MIIKIYNKLKLLKLFCIGENSMCSKVSKADNKLRKLLSEKRLKGDEDRNVGSEVFDRLTLETLYKLAKMGYINQLQGAISTGKEANVFKGIDDEGILWL